jgi:hypothetical protein
MAQIASRSNRFGFDTGARLTAATLALGYTFAAFGAVLSPAPAAAQSGGFYVAELVQPTEETRTVASGVAWRCDGSTCAAPKAASRPLRVCRELQRKVGPVASFTAHGEALDAEDLARCNG